MPRAREEPHLLDAENRHDETEGEHQRHQSLRGPGAEPENGDQPEAENQYHAEEEMYGKERQGAAGPEEDAEEQEGDA